MKQIMKLVGIIAIVAIIGFGFASCDDGGGGGDPSIPGGNEPNTDPCANGHNYLAWTAPTCTVPGNNERICTRSDCGNVDTRTTGFAALGHDWEYFEDDALVLPTCEENGHGSRECTRIGCDVVEDDMDFPALGHDWNFKEGEHWDATTIPNCVETGEEQRKCQRIECEKTEERELPIDEDGHDIIVVDGVAPTCTKNGYGTIKCDRDGCDYTKTGDVLEAINHNFVDHWEVIIAATCSATGTEQRFCVRECGETGNKQERTIAIFDCEYDHWVEINASNITDLTKVEIQRETCKFNSDHFNIRTVPLTEYITLKTENSLEPVALKISIELSTGSSAMTTSNSGWRQLRNILAAAGKPVTLDLSDSTFGTNKAFDTGTENSYPKPGLNNIVSIVLPNTAASIGSSAFSGCSSLTSITIPDSVTSIGGSAFYYCRSLTSITIPDSVTSIGAQAFCGCSSLTSITIPFVGNTLTGATNTYFGYIFGAENSITAAIIPASLKTVNITGGNSIANNAFSGCSSLTSITIGNSVTSIGGSAFRGCSSLTSITIPDSVTSIGGYAFNGCSSLTSITMGNSVTSIDGYAFQNCSSLTSIDIPNSVTSIGEYAFDSCSSLSSIPIPDSVTSIGRSAFSDCSSLTSIMIPESVTSIGQYAFDGCTGLTSVTFEGTITSTNFNTFKPFPGDLRDKYLAGGIGTYTRESGSNTWTKQD